MEEKRIVIVDNNSPNDSFSLLLSNYKDDPEIILLHSDKNLGFSGGNNIGFLYAKQHFNPQFIIMINNDTLITQDDFLNLISQKYQKYNFAVLGPDIVTKDGIHQNPWIRDGFSYLGIRLFRMKQRTRIILSYLHLDSIIYNLLQSKSNRNRKIDGDIIGATLHGSALIFSEQYINIFDGLDARTFLYLEEEILKLYCNHYKLKTLYSSELEIYHKEDVSTNHIFANNEKKTRFELKNRIDSSFVYEKVQKELKNNQ